MKLLLYLSVIIAVFGCVATPRPALVDYVVRIEVYSNDKAIDSGTGTIIGYDGEYKVLTASHVVDPVSNAKIYIITDREAKLEAKVISRHDKLDAALLSFRSDIAYPIAVAGPLPPPLTPVYTIGYPLSIGKVVTSGILNYPIANSVESLCTAQVSPGNSGGAVFDQSSGALIGMTVKVCMVDLGFGLPQMVSYLHLFLPMSLLSKWIGENT